MNGEWFVDDDKHIRSFTSNETTPQLKWKSNTNGTIYLDIDHEDLLACFSYTNATETTELNNNAVKISPDGTKEIFIATNDIDIERGEVNDLSQLKQVQTSTNYIHVIGIENGYTLRSMFVK